MHKEIKALVRTIEGVEGWRVVRGGKHYKALSPDGKRMVPLPLTPSCSRSMKNTVADLRRIGFPVRGKR